VSENVARQDDPFGLNAAQRAAAYDLDHHIVLGSGAGCGKTRVLVARIVRALEQPGMTVGHIAAITFGEKAAGEMITRLRQACRDRAAKADTDDERRRWRVHLGDLERARISTIHAFCGRLLREHAAEAGVDPRFAVLEDLPAGIKREEAVAQVTSAALAADEAGARLLAAEYGLAGMRDLLGRLLRFRAAAHRANEGCREKVMGGERRMGPSYDLLPMPFLSADDFLDRWRRTALDSPALRQPWETLRAHEPTDVTDKAAVQRAEALARLAEAEQADDPALALGILHELGGSINLWGGSKKKWPSAEALAAVKRALKGLQNLFKQGSLKIQRQAAAVIERRAADVTVALWRLFERCEEAYANAKAEASELDFDDLLIRARDLLRDNPDVRRRVRASMKHLLVDELQDTDRLQMEIVLSLVGDEPRPSGGASPRGGEGDDGPVLFAVGDPKQSIYRFRGAEVEVFDSLTRRVEAWPTGRARQLEETYRTHARGVAFVNEFFGRLFGEAGADKGSAYDVGYQAVASGTEWSGPARPVVSMIEVAEAGERAPARRSREAEGLAATIRAMVETEQPSIRDPETDAPRPLRYGDVAMLFRSFRSAATYERALEAEGVPFYTVSGRAFYQRQEVRDVLLALKVIDNAHDEASLVGVLRSPLVGLSDEALYWMTAKDGSVSAGLARAEEVPNLTPDDREALVEARSLLNRLRAVKDRLGVPALIERLLAETGYDAEVLTQFAGRRRLANLRRLVDLAGQLAPFGTLSQVIDRLDDLATAEVPGQEGAVAEEAGDVVRLMTVHAAKGLEFPVVIVPDLPRTPPPGKSTALTGPLVGLTIPVRADDGSSFRTIARGLASHEETARDEAEDRRVLYVAVTRARDRVVLSGVRPSKGHIGRWMEWYEEHATDLGVEALSAPPSGPAPGAGAGDSQPGTAAPHRRTRPPIDAVVRDGLVEWGKVSALIAAATEKGADPLGQRGLSPFPADTLVRRVAPLPGSWTRRRWFGAREFADYDRCPFAYRLRHVEDFPDPLPSFDESAPPSRRGRVAHAALERLDFQCGAAGVEDAVAFALAREPALAPDEADDLRAWVTPRIDAFLESSVAARIQSAAETKRELSFTLRVGNAYVRGKIDILWRDAAGDWHLADYKTDEVEADGVARRAAGSALQVQVYALAARALAGRPPADAALFYVVPQVAHSVAIDAAALDATQSRLADAIARIRAGEFPRHHHAGCQWCAYRHFCQEA